MPSGAAAPRVKLQDCREAAARLRVCISFYDLILNFSVSPTSRWLSSLHPDCLHVASECPGRIVHRSWLSQIAVANPASAQPGSVSQKPLETIVHQARSNESSASARIPWPVRERRMPRSSCPASRSIPTKLRGPVCWSK